MFCPVCGSGHVHGNAFVDLEARIFREGDLRTHPHAYHDQIGVDRRAILQGRGPAVDARHRGAEVKDNALGFVQAANETAHFGAHYPLERLLLGRHDVHVELACA
jgi:hypothetical protein